MIRKANKHKTNKLKKVWQKKTWYVTVPFAFANLATIANSQTEVNIKIGGFFEYQETITILTTIDK